MKTFKMHTLLIAAACLLLPLLSAAQFRVVGYVRTGKNWLNDMAKINLDQVTQINVAFINPEGNGEFKEMPQLDTVIGWAHKKNVKVFLACGGGSRHITLDTLLNDKNRSRVVANFMTFIDRYKFDGLDVDIENEDINDNYGPFVLAIGEQLHKQGKQISSALSYSTRNKIPASALAMYDAVNLMAYDKTAPWRPNEPGPHSPYDMAVSQINYWAGERGVPKSKINIGVPFYGYGFGPSGVSSMSFAEIMKSYPGNEDNDEATMMDGGTMYYNGFKTIRKKTKLAQQKAGGIMIWQLFSDAEGDKSLLNQIHQQITASK